MTVPTQNVPDPNGTDWQQPPWDQRMTWTPLLQYDPTSATGGLKRGYIRQAYANTTGSLQPVQRTFSFLYNPSSVSVSHTVSTSDGAYDPAVRPAIDPGTVLLPTGATVSLSLLLDRTYEVSNPANFGANGTISGSVGELGVAADINALYALCGILHLQNTSPSMPSTVVPGLTAATNSQKAEAIAIQVVKSERPNIDKASTASGLKAYVTQDSIKFFQKEAPNRQLAADIIKQLTAAGLSVSDLPTKADSITLPTPAQLATNPTYGPAVPVQAFGYMTPEPVVVVLGEQRGSWSPVLQYYGFINNLDIEYTHWTQRLVPMRAAVSLTVNLMATQSNQIASMIGGGP